MKPHKLLLILSLMIFSTNIFAQNNDMKARMEFEDAETAYQNQDYSKTVTHLENAEKLLGKPTGKTRYLLILALNKNLAQDYQYQDLEKLKKLSKHYLDNYTTDTEKYREIYDLSNSLNRDYPKNLEEFNIVLQKREEQKKIIQKKEEINKANANFVQKIRTFKPSLGGVSLGMNYNEFPSNLKSGSYKKYHYSNYDEVSSGDYKSNNEIYFVRLNKNEEGAFQIIFNTVSTKRKNKEETLAQFEKMYESLVNAVGKENVYRGEDKNDYWKFIVIQTPKQKGYQYKITYREGLKTNNIMISEELSSKEFTF